MGKALPSLRIDIAGTLYVSFVLRDARRQCQGGQANRQVSRAVENAEIRNLAECLKLQGMQVVADGGFRSYDFLESWEGIRCKGGVDFLSGGELEVTGRISLLHHPVLGDFVFLAENIVEGVLLKQHMPSPGKLLMGILCETETECLKSIYLDLNLLLDDLAVAYKNLLEKPREAECHYAQSEGMKSTLTDEATRLNDRVLRERPEELFVAFYATMDTLIRLYGADVYFLNYDYGICDRSRLLWFVHEREAVLGFVSSYYPDEEELGELQVKMEEVSNYIPVKHLMPCPPGVDNLLNSLEEDEMKQWKTAELAKDMAAHIFFA